MEIARQIGGLLVVWTREPSLLLAWAVVIAIVCGAGRSIGLPLLFWHERFAAALFAGIAATLLTSEIFFVLYLIDGQGPRGAGAGLSLEAHLATGGALWLAVVAVRAFQLARAGRAGAGQPASAAGQPAGAGNQGVTPRIQRVVAAQSDVAGGGERLGHLQTAHVSPWPFVLGVALGAAAVALWLLSDDRWLRAQLDPLAAALIGRWSPGLARSPDLHLHVMAALTSAALLVVFWLVRRWATPAVGLCMLLSLFAASYGCVTFWTGSRGLLLVAGFALFWLAGRVRYRLRLPALAARYPGAGGAPAAYPPAPEAAGPGGGEPALLLDRLVSAGGAAGDWPAADLPAKRPLVLICTSGGGIRAAAWTAGVLGRLDALGGFRLQARMLTGASGGMVGAAGWLAWRHAKAEKSADERTRPAGADDWRTLLRCAASDGLTAAGRRLFFRDIPMAFWPGANRHDRGRAVEDTWIAAAAAQLDGARLDVPITALRRGEAEGWWPSVVFTPTLIEDGRRLVLSNLDLRNVIVNQARWLGRGAIGVFDTSSVAAYHAAALFPQEWRNFPLSTAARVQAAFPYVSPAVVLPTVPRRRIVDAGYYDNYGLDLTCGWLVEALERQREWLAAHVSGVLIVQIRDNVSNLSINPDSASELRHAPAATAGSTLARGLEGLTSPPEGLLAAMDSVALFRNDAQLETVTHLYDAAFGRSDFVTTCVFEFKGEASLSWYLTAEEIGSIEDQVASQAIDDKLGAIAAWLRRYGGVPPSVA